MFSSSIQNERKWGEAFTTYFRFIWFGFSPCSIVISSFNSYYQNNKNQEKSVNLVVAETGEQAFLRSQPAGKKLLTISFCSYLFHKE